MGVPRRPESKAAELRDRGYASALSAGLTHGMLAGVGYRPVVKMSQHAL